jgi:hypothetical protein
MFSKKTRINSIFSGVNSIHCSVIFEIISGPDSAQFLELISPQTSKLFISSMSLLFSASAFTEDLSVI